MKRLSIISVYFIAFMLSVNSLSAQLDTNAKISILTCGAGFEFFESFGHTALRICDSTSDMDYVFNWGSFDFNTDNFYLKFTQGKLPYLLGISTYQRFVAEYAMDGRSMYEQELNLTYIEKNILYNAVIENYKPENRYYHYDFFLDNCATRVRDIIQNSLQDRHFPIDTITNKNLTFRQLFYPYADNYLWWKFAIDIALGTRADKKASKYDYMYLPNDLMYQFDTTLLTGDNQVLSNSKQIVLEEQCVHSTPTIFSPDMVFWLLFICVVVLTFFELRKGFYAKVFDITFFFILCMLSLLVFYLCFISDHNATKYNLNLLWANPLLFYVLIRLRKSNFIVLCIISACIFILLAGFWILPQSFNSAFYPIWLIIALRLTLLLLHKRKRRFINFLTL